MLNPKEPAVSVVLITKNEAANLPDCLGRLMTQTFRDFEIIAIDSASTDGTVATLRSYAEKMTEQALVLEASPVNLSFGDARNRGIALARGRNVAFVSADAYPDAHWLEELTGSLAEADIVYGRQVHAPAIMNAATASRGLRYHHFSKPDLPPEAYASNVNAGFRREVFQRVRYDDDATASEDLLLTRKARRMGLKVAYNPRMIVHHKDVASFKGELRKHAREGYAGGRFVRALGVNHAYLGWGAALGIALLGGLLFPTVALPLIVGLLYAPTFRRLVGSRPKYPVAALAGGIAVSPVFDLIYLGNYLKGLVNAK